MDITRYGIDVRWSEQDSAFLATCPSFPRLSAFGDTREDALQEGEVVLRLYLEEYADDGVEPPAPVEAVEYSGQTRLRLPKSAHARLAQRAHAEGVSMNQLALSYIERGLAGADFSDLIQSQVDRMGKHMTEQRSSVHSLRQEVARLSDHNHVFDQIVFTAYEHFSSKSVDYNAVDLDGPETQDPALRRIYRDNAATYSS